MTGGTLPFTAGHLRPGVGPALIVIKRFSRCIGALPFEASGRDGSVAKYGDLHIGVLGAVPFCFLVKCKYPSFVEDFSVGLGDRNFVGDWRSD
jgi:hypothetical protein